MGVVNLKSTIIGNRDATPKVLTDPFISGGDVKASYGYVTTGATDSIASTYRLCQVPSNARVRQILLSCVALGGTCAANVGVYYPTFIPVGAGLSASNASAAISASLFAAAQSLVSALNHVDVTDQSGTYTIALQEDPLWLAAGLAADPMIDLDIVVALTVANTNGGLLGMDVTYIE